MSKKLPSMTCERGCGECCGPVLCREDEYRNVVGYAKSKGIEPIRQGITCPFYQDGQCAVHEARPFICRVFGHFKDLVCSRGHNVNVPAGEQAKRTRDYGRGGEVTRFLHETCYSVGEIKQLHVDYLEGINAKLGTSV